MNFQGKAVLVYLEEDNIARAYFRVQPLMTQDGPVGPMAAEFPDDGFLRIVPDKNEQHTFKERMRTLIGLCLVDLRFFPMDANKIRTNKNYSPLRGETNQFIVYSDAVRALPDDLLFQVVGENDVRNAVTPFVYIRNGANIQGPFRRENGQSAGDTAQLPPDSCEIHSAQVNGQELLFYWPRKAAPAPEKPIEKTIVAENPIETPAAPIAEEQKEETPVQAEQPAQPSALEQIQSLNEPVSENANKLKTSPTPAPVELLPEQNAKPLTGTRLYQTPQRQTAPRRAHNPLMEVVENQRYASRYETRYEAPGATIPQNAELREVNNPADALKRALQGMSHSPEAQRQAADVILNESGMRVMLSRALAHETNDLTLAAMHSQLQELEAERLMTLMQLDDAKKNLAAAHEEALGKLSMAEQKKLDQLHIAQQTAQNELDKLNKALEPLEEKRREIVKAVQDGENATDYNYLCAPVGQDASKEELIERVEKAFRASGFIMEEDDALALLTALALTKESFEICSDTEADAQAALYALACALGTPLKEAKWIDRLVMLPGGNAPVFVEYNSFRHPLVWQVSVGSPKNADLTDEWQFPYPSVPVIVDQDALPQALPEFAPVTKDCILKAFVRDAALSDETKAAVAALRKGLKDVGAPLPVASVDMLCRFVSATQNELKGGVADAIDRAACLFIAPHLKDKGIDPENVKALLAAMPRALKALNA